MKKVLVIADEFHPYSNANTNCLDKILDGLVRGGFDVTVLCFSYGESIPTQDERNGCHIRRIRVPYDRFEQRFDKKLFHANNPFSSMLLSLFSKAEGIYGRYYKQRRIIRLCKSWRTEPFDLLLSGLCPIASHMFAYMIAKREKYPWILYNMDSFVFNCETKQTINHRKRIEKKWCKKAVAVINTFGLCEHNRQNGYYPYRCLPQLEIPLPNLEISDTLFTTQNKQSGKIVMRYIGSFFENVRRPDTLLQFLEKLDAQEFTVEFYGSCCDYVRKQFTHLPNCLSLMGFVTADECKALTQTSDILINVGNDCTNQMPSKVFEYVASGKPILNFYTRGDEPGLQYLRRYPRILHLRNADDADADALRALPSTPEVTAEELRGIYKDVLSETVCDQVVRFAEKVVGT